MAKKNRKPQPQDSETENSEEVVDPGSTENETEAKATETEGESVKSALKGIKAEKQKSEAKASTSGKGAAKPAPVPPGSTTAKSTISKKKLAILLSVAGGLLIAAGVAGYLVFGSGSKTSDQSNTSTSNTNSDGLVRRIIDGVFDTPEHQNRYPVAVMVENHTQARPQSGLDRANIVFEALAEGGITRFLAIFTLTNPVEEIGPVRSARSYYVDWARGYDAMYVHAGGSPSGLARIGSVGLTDLNQFFNSQYFFRDRSRNVATEHTLYTTSTLLSRAIVDKKLSTDGSFDGWTFKTDAAEAERGTAQKITIDFSAFNYKVGYVYDQATNAYKRSLAEQPHVMRDGTALAPKNVVVIRVNRSLENAADDHGRLAMTTIGSGPAQFFIDGKVTNGTWKKTSAQASLELLDENGAAVNLNAGQTWVEVVPPELSVTVE